MFALLLTAAMSVVPHEVVVSDEADVIELNHYFDENGKRIFDQAIFWQWCDARAEHHVFAWRFAKQPGQVPSRDWSRNGYVTIWFDGKTLRRVRSYSMRETWTQFDPEVHDRAFFRQSERRELSRRREVKPVVGVQHDQPHE